MQLAEEGHSVKALEEKPRLYPDLYLDYRAFALLSASRPIGFTAAPIPLSEIFAYMQIFEIRNYGQRTHFLQRIKFLDHVYLKLLKEKEK